jgi:hypothetical protein
MLHPCFTILQVQTADAQAGNQRRASECRREGHSFPALPGEDPESICVARPESSTRALALPTPEEPALHGIEVTNTSQHGGRAECCVRETLWISCRSVCGAWCSGSVNWCRSVSRACLHVTYPRSLTGVLIPGPLLLEADATQSAESANPHAVISSGPQGPAH